jgi:hypothetical protein
MRLLPNRMFRAGPMDVTVITLSILTVMHPTYSLPNRPEAVIMEDGFAVVHSMKMRQV